MAVVLAVGITALIGFAAIVVDIGALYHVEAPFQIACDATALSGASHIDGTEIGLERATEAALATGTLNKVSGEAIPAGDLHFTFGIWDPTTAQFTASTDTEAINALKVDSEPHSVNTPLAGAAWGMGLKQVFASSIAIRPPAEPATGVDCFLPIAIPLCRFEAIEAGGHPWIMASQLANDSNDSIAWAHPDGASTANVIDALSAAGSGECPAPGLEIGDPVPMTNGVQSATLISIHQLLHHSEDPWDNSLWGTKPAADEHSDLIPNYGSAGIIQGPIAVFDESTVGCGAVKFNQTEPFVWGVLFDVYSGPGQHKGAQIYIDMEHDFETPGSGGGGTGNVKARPPGQLVNP